MCVSGLPIVVENEHVKNICNMALKIRQTAKNFKIKHMPKELLRVRIGIHSGIYTYQYTTYLHTSSKLGGILLFYDLLFFSMILL